LAEVAQVAANLSYEEFVNRYLGAYASDPALDPAGNAPIEGSLYWSTGSAAFKVFTMGAWQFTNLTFGTAAYVDVGTAADQVPLNSDLGSSSLVDTGLLTGNVPTADQLSMVGQTVNFTAGNLNPNVFGGNVAGDIVCSGIFSTNGLLNCFLKLVSKTNPVSITVVGTFAIYDDTGVLKSTISTPTLSLDSSNKEALLLFGGAGGVNIRTETYTVRAVTAASKITVNF
jgi:hypothetical protein